MTTKFEHPIINPLTRNNNFAVITHHCHPKPQGCLLTVKNPPSMDRILESHKIESMRKKMLMQEQLFKHQVQELHRLYNQQRKVMQEIENGLKQRKETDTTVSEFTIRHHHHSQTETESKQSFEKEYTNQSSAAEKAPRPIKFDLENTPSSSMPPFGDDDDDGLKKMDEVEVELTLSIGHCTRKGRSEIQDSASSSSTKTDNAMSSSSVYQETTRPHWLLQDLSLNRT
ncbi:uncharacterized protein LOC131004599 isoform X2 [Salvia miltiorrhiza]|uniref:uncharacterized protein LOC131004599 isoform X2 n=1 Tax=Salvia miltiorrhiza TaxID=226208 RepID=UPI0025ACA25A|nr:uncharacterized protein LOC131004599 isoform X2 [Salvia miltiorrhiza]XP_057787292.1 uncharacterized protein LOC131004599 isoform X2 [Salvia miltiorrhiza]